VDPQERADVLAALVVDVFAFVLGPLFAPMYERIARTGPTRLAMKAPSPGKLSGPPRSNVSSLRAQLPGA
jgi:hypothetical protein